MTAIRAQIMAKIKQRLIGLNDAAETKVMPPGEPVEFPARHIFESGHSVDESDLSGTRYGFTPTIEGYVEGSSGDAVYAEINELYANTVRALITDPPLDGLAETIDEGDMRLFVATLASKPRMGFSLEIAITFPTRREDPAQAA